LVGTAPTQVAGQGASRLLDRRIRIGLEQRYRRDHLARRAVSALRTDLLDERFLDRVELSVFGDPFDGRDLLIGDGVGQRRA
jgi:hypothetical protein